MLVKIRRKRLERGLTLSAAAKRAGVAAQVLAQVERGRQRPWPALRRRLAEMYGVPEGELFEDIDSAENYLRRLAGEERP